MRGVVVAGVVVAAACGAGCGESSSSSKDSGRDGSGGTAPSGGVASGGTTTGGTTTGGATTGGAGGSSAGSSPMGGAGGEVGGAAGAAGESEGGEGGQPPDPCNEGTVRCLEAIGNRQRCTEGAWVDEEFACAISVRVEDFGGTACATKADGRFHCWDATGFSMLPPEPVFPARVRAVLGQGSFPTSWDGALIWLADGTLWTYPTHAEGEVAWFDREHLSGDICVVHEDGSAECDRADLSPVAPPDGARYRQVVQSGIDLCTLSDLGSVRCRFSTFGGLYAELAIGNFVCALTLGGAIECVSPAAVDLGFEPPTGKFTRIAMADESVCGIRDSGEIACAGTPAQVPAPPAGAFTEIDGGDWAHCAISVDGSVRCFTAFGGDREIPEGW